MRKSRFFLVSAVLCSSILFNTTPAAATEPNEKVVLCTSLLRVAMSAAEEAKERDDLDIFKTFIYGDVGLLINDEAGKRLFDNAFRLAQVVIRDEGGTVEQAGIIVGNACLKA